MLVRWDAHAQSRDDDGDAISVATPCFCFFRLAFAGGAAWHLCRKKISLPVLNPEADTRR